jgi:hypothetical protein
VQLEHVETRSGQGWPEATAKRHGLDGDEDDVPSKRARGRLSALQIAWPLLRRVALKERKRGSDVGARYAVKPHQLNKQAAGIAQLLLSQVRF